MRRTARFMLSLTPRTRKALDRLARATNRPMTTCAAEILDEAAPMIETLAKVAEDITAKKAGAYQSVAVALAESQLRAAQLNVDFHQHMPVGKKARK